MIAKRAITVCLVVALASMSAPALSQVGNKGMRVRPDRERDRSYSLGGGGWSLERFGKNIAILRTGVTASGPRSEPIGLFFLSCEGGEHRWRLSFRERVLPGGDVATSGTILVRPSGSGGRSDFARVGEVQIASGRAMTLAENRSSSGGFVPAFVRLLRTRPEHIDLLVRTTNATLETVLFGPLLPAYVFSSVLTQSDIVAFDDFLAACTSGPQ